MIRLYQQIHFYKEQFLVISSQIMIFEQRHLLYKQMRFCLLKLQIIMFFSLIQIFIINQKMNDKNPYNQNSYFKDRKITANDLFNQIETDLKLIKGKCKQQIQKTNLQHEKEMYNEVLDHMNQMIQHNNEKQIIFKSNHSYNNENQIQQSTNIKLDSQIRYCVTFEFENETKEEEFSHQLSFKELYLFLLKESSFIIKQMFVILDQQANIINPNDWEQPFICGDKADSRFIIQSLSQYLMTQQSVIVQRASQIMQIESQIVPRESQIVPVESQILPRDSQKSTQSQKRSEVQQLFKSQNHYVKDVQKESKLYQYRSTIQKQFYSKMSTIVYQCKNCNQEIQNQQIMLKCYHNYHEDCLTSMLKSQIQSGQSILNCICNQKIHINELDLLTYGLKQNLYKNQIDTIYQKYQGQFMKCKNCYFFYMKTQNKSQIRSACIMCSN
ncbi:unnamed protein product (macronuclear) [Paramecium tetraurelia]|uniref:RING-type domain-containing protein n=1 Tax=Paramecium tetraurelia TaxID=5888 RepID=A0DBW8_PARTE|nr:uncharacterized protein GSPATT00015412001 [Paramecium tetraurelia]CAK80535.1 unnamed protein product [Paramecium tetraurelia]|eukprot:XP_001447932.1 hypothetical protein (macronuclear) [Paramecium tetraurelia strain d4-2]